METKVRQSVNFDEESEDIYAFEKRSGKTSHRTGTERIQPTSTSNRRDAGNTAARPMTSVRAAGYSSRGRPGGSSKALDAYSQSKRTGTPTKDTSPEETIKIAENKISNLLHESYLLSNEGSIDLALEKAKDANKRERLIAKQRESLNIADQTNLDLTYSVFLNLANLYHLNKMHEEALATYSIIVKNKLFNQSARLRVNMGNIYFEQGKMKQAIKMYRMALDQIPSTNKNYRLRIMRNIGSSFVKMGDYLDAITAFESIMDDGPDISTAFNLVLCCFASGEKEKMKKAYQRLISIPALRIEQDEHDKSLFKDAIEDHHVFDEDSLRAITHEKHQTRQHLFIVASKLVASKIDASFTEGCVWVLDSLKLVGLHQLASEMEIAKALEYLKTKDFQHAIDDLKEFLKSNEALVGISATNLSFIYFLEGEFGLCEQYADIALKHDKYNSKAQTNRGNCFAIAEDYKKASVYYHEAISSDASCTEAMFNLGIVCKRQKRYQEALGWFLKLYSILKCNVQVIYQIADIYDLQGESEKCIEWLGMLISIVPTDVFILARLGEMLDEKGDKSQAYQYYSDSYRYHPSNISVVSWLGYYYAECDVHEKAVIFFERAVLIEPRGLKWQMMVSNCYRRSGNYQRAYEFYKKIHERFPEDAECLRQIITICIDLGKKEGVEYAAKLAAIEGPRLGTGQSGQKESAKDPVAAYKMGRGDIFLIRDDSSKTVRPVFKHEPIEFEIDIDSLLPE